jgi:hypothetical protein
MAREKNIFDIYVDYEYGCDETYTVEAYTLAEAKKKAKNRFMKEYFKKSYVKASKAY